MFWCSFHTSLSLFIDWYVCIGTINILEGHSSSQTKQTQRNRKTEIAFSCYKQTIISVPKLGDFICLKKEVPKLLTVKAKYPSRLWVSVMSRNVQKKKIWEFQRKYSVTKLTKEAFENLELPINYKAVYTNEVLALEEISNKLYISFISK